MKGNQTVELTPKEQMLSKAMGIHMKNDNCCGTLIYTCWVSLNIDLTYKVHHFICKKCHEVIEVNEKANQS